jgi:hypothetical protein
MACLTKLGHSVIGVDVSAEKVALVAAGQSPILEPQVPELLAEAHAAGLIPMGGRVHALGHFRTPPVSRLIRAPPDRSRIARAVRTARAG